MLLRKIDIATGLFIEDVILDENPNPLEYIEKPCPGGFYHPKWVKASQLWIEGGQAPTSAEPQKTEIELLKEQNENLQNLIAQTNADFAAFMDFYFQNNPDLA
jgi:hypothetical protein